MLKSQVIMLTVNYWNWNMNNEPYPRITISVGVSTSVEDEKDIRQLVKSADNALLNAKKNGKNCVA